MGYFIYIYIYVIFFTIQRKIGCYHNYFYMFIILISSCNGSGGLYFWIKVILALVFVVDITYINLSPLIVERRSLLKSILGSLHPITASHCLQIFGSSCRMAPYHMTFLPGIARLIHNKII